MRPKFSVIMLAHQNAWCIGAALASVRTQTFVDWECLVCDDASTDETRTIVESFLHDSRISYLRHDQNIKQPANWWTGIRASQGEFVATLHADDIWFDTTLATYMKSFQSHSGVDLVLGAFERCDEHMVPLVHQPPITHSQKLTGNEGFEYLLKTNLALPSSSAFRRSLAEAAGAPYHDYGMLCDRDYLLRLASQSQSVAVLNEVVMKYRVHPLSVTKAYTDSGKLLKEMLHFDSRIADLAHAHPHGRQLVSDYRRRVSEFFFRSAMSARLAGDWRTGIKLLKKSLANNPKLLLRPTFFVKFVLFWVGKKLLGLVHGRNNFVITAEPT